MKIEEKGKGTEKNEDIFFQPLTLFKYILNYKDL